MNQKCVGCDTPIPNGGIKCPMCGAQVQGVAGNKKIIITQCSDCGEALENDNGFCGKCGVLQINKSSVIVPFSQPSKPKSLGKFKYLLYGVGLLILFLAFAPENRTNAVIEAWRRVTSDDGQACLDYTREKVKNPSSIRLIEWNEKSGILKYKATNSYGAYVEDTQKCYISGAFGGVVDKELTESSIQAEENLKATQKLVQEIKVRNLEKKLQQMNHPASSYGVSRQ
jgi:hypothetical protein